MVAMDDSITAKGAAKHTIFGGSGDDVIDATVGDRRRIGGGEEMIRSSLLMAQIALLVEPVMTRLQVELAKTPSAVAPEKTLLLSPTAMMMSLQGQIMMKSLSLPRNKLFSAAKVTTPSSTTMLQI